MGEMEIGREEIAKAAWRAASNTDLRLHLATLTTQLSQKDAALREAHDLLCALVHRPELHPTVQSIRAALTPQEPTP